VIGILSEFDGYRMLTVEPPGPRFKLVPIGDLHLGSPHFKRALLLSTLQWALEENAYIFLTGDLLECGTKGSVGAGVYEQLIPPAEQIERVIEILDPVKHLILGAVKGNHEERLHKDSGVDIYEAAICPRLGIPYFKWEAFVFFSLPHYRTCFVYVNHTKSGSQNAPLALNWMIRQLVQVVDADLYMKSHDHGIGWHPAPVLKVNRNTGAMEMKERHFMLTGNWLGRADSYAAASASGHKPAGTTVADIDLRTGRIEPIYRR
jgi:hypothetical protein